MVNPKKNTVLNYTALNQGLSSKEIFDGLNFPGGYSSLKRVLVHFTAEKLLVTRGQGKATKYYLSPGYELLYPIPVDLYFETEMDDRPIKPGFNLSIIGDALSKVELFTPEESEKLVHLNAQFQSNRSKLSEYQVNQEIERVSIDLCWKSSQLQGCQYSLLQTEQLVQTEITAADNTITDAKMIMNHWEALQFAFFPSSYFSSIAMDKIEEVYHLLISDTRHYPAIRTCRAGIVGTTYKPPQDPDQLAKACDQLCDLINSRDSIFEKALLFLVLIPYIQPFTEGNNSVSRIVASAVLYEKGYCPISFRTMDSALYKKAMLLFFEQNNFNAIKQLFIREFEFAVNTYF